MSAHPRRQLGPGYFFSPGYYMAYWHDAIMPNFTPEQIAFHVKLKQHREVWVGAHLAAAKTRLSGQQFFVALPESDPPDVLIGSLERVTVSSGRVGYNLKWFQVEITRCDEAAGETLFNQIQKKNKQTYRDMVLAVYLQGAIRVPDLAALNAQLTSLGEFYPQEVVVMVELDPDANDVPQGTFAFAQVYPNYEAEVIRRDDPVAYFMDPNILTVTGRGIQSHLTRLGSMELMPPNIPQL